MAYSGWLSFAGTEILNVARTQAYMADAAPGVLRDCDCACGNLHEALGDQPYRNPGLDHAPWFDPDVPWSGEFFGLYPLSVSGLEDSTRATAITESIGAGGSVTGRRFASREVRVRGVLLASTDRGAEYGQDWLSSVLDGSCETCHGDAVCFFNACPDACAVPRPRVTVPVDLQHLGADGGNWDGSRWTPRNGASVLWTPRLRLPLPCTVSYEWTVRGPAGGVVWLRAGGENDGVQGREALVLDGDVQTFTVDDRGWSQNWIASSLAVSEDGTGPALGGTVEVLSVKVTHSLEHEDPVSATNAYLRQLREVVALEGPRKIREQRGVNFVMREIDLTLAAVNPFVYSHEIPVAGLRAGLQDGRAVGTIARTSVGVPDCAESPALLPVGPYGVLDPDAPRVPPPLLLEPLTRGGWTVKSEDHYVITVPDSVMPTWTDMVPVLRMATADLPARNVRVRFFPMTMQGMSHTDLSGCDSCGAFNIDYIPPNSEFTLDGMTERASVRFNGTSDEHLANHLLSSDGPEIFTWPVLSCGIGYFAAIDVDYVTLPVISLSLVARRS